MSASEPIDELAALFAQTHEALKRHAARSVDAALVARNWLFGAYIEEFERGGASRSSVYGKRVVEALADRLKPWDFGAVPRRICVDFGKCIWRTLRFAQHC